MAKKCSEVENVEWKGNYMIQFEQKKLPPKD
jgi:hypothetical protein